MRLGFPSRCSPQGKTNETYLALQNQDPTPGWWEHNETLSKALTHLRLELTHNSFYKSDPRPSLSFCLPAAAAVVYFAQFPTASNPETEASPFPYSSRHTSTSLAHICFYQSTPLSILETKKASQAFSLSCCLLSWRHLWYSSTVEVRVIFPKYKRLHSNS